MTGSIAAQRRFPATSFRVPPNSEASAPPERRGLSRAGVRLLVARPGEVEHRHFSELAGLLLPGDLLVVNTSATLAAALDGQRSDGRVVPVHVSTWLDDGDWVVELRRPDGSGPDLTATTGDRLTLPGGLELHLVAAYPGPGSPVSRLWRAAPTPRVAATAYLAGHGRPIAYPYLAGRFPLDDFQTVYATEPGSAEMASAGRPFTAELLVGLVARGIAVAPLVLHAGVSSQEAHEPPLPERFQVPATTAGLVESTRAGGGRVLAVGTTVVRALESAVDARGTVCAVSGWTDLVLGPDHPVRAVTGLLTGLHAPQASHLLLLEAVAGPELVAAAYAGAVEQGYLWHEFGDSTLFLP